MSKSITLPPVVTPAQWRAAHKALPVKEMAVTRDRDALAVERQRQPSIRIARHYVFDGNHGRVGLIDLFEARRQLIRYHFMFAPGADGWPNAGCPGCPSTIRRHRSGLGGRRAVACRVGARIAYCAPPIMARINAIASYLRR